MIDLPEDFSFDPLTDGGGQLDPDVVDDEAENRAHAALFAHVGITDPADWRSVALRLACRYAPDVLMGSEPCEPASPAKKAGRPKEWDEMAHIGLLRIITEIRDSANKGIIKRNLSTAAAACYFFAKDPQAESYRSRAWMVPTNVEPATLQNRLSAARRMWLEYHKGVTEIAAE
ncbi:hypothetical protein R1A27_18120 [Methylobacterium sp. NMS12]|uniref:hypothetical protein n=1 Tax=Methylobacterium sp. NMS12 TaxID=3079766 RepID=UPI003F884F29